MELKIAMWLSIIWIALIIIFMIILLQKFTFSDNNPHEKETFGLPRGVFRGIITLSILFIVILLQVSTLYVKPVDVSILNKVFENITIKSDEALNNILGKLLIPEERFSQLMIAFQMVIAFYFGGKIAHHVTAVEKYIAKDRTEKAVIEVKERAKISNSKSFEDEEAVG